MKTTLLLTALFVGCLTATAQNVPAPATRPDRLDPIRFREFDVNKDGKLDLQEQAAEKASRPAWEASRARAAQEHQAKLTARQQQLDLERFDANKDGKLDETETKSRDTWHAERRKEFLAKYDKNGDGKVSPDELKPAQK